MIVRFYRRQGGAAAQPAALPSGWSSRIWAPGEHGFPPVGSRRASNWVWWAFEVLGVFSRPGFFELTLWREDRLAHRLIVTPRWSRFAFMDPGDLQIGDVWTHPDFRGQGLARQALAMVQALTDPDDQLWYLVEADNAASIRLARAAGYARVGDGRRTRPLGLSPLGRFQLD